MLRLLDSVIKPVLVDHLNTAPSSSRDARGPVGHHLALSAAVFYINRTLRVTEGMLYGSTAAGLVALILAYETPHQYICVAWLGFAAALFETGFRLRQPEFRYQAYVIGAFGTGAGFIVNSLGISAFGARLDWPLPWLPLAICATLHYAATLRIGLSKDDDRLGDGEKNISWITSACATGFLFIIAWKLVPGGYLGAAWMILGAGLFELGLRSLPKHFRWSSYFVSSAGVWNIFWNRVVDAQIGSINAQAISLGIATLVCFTLSARLFRAMPDRIGDWERGWTRDLNAAAGVLFAMTLAWLKLPAPVVALVWALLCVALFEIAVRFTISRFRLIAHLTTAAVCARLLMFDLTGFGDSLHLTHRSLTFLPILASHYYVWWRDRRASSRIYLYTPVVFFILLARFELGPRFAIVAWALFGLALYEIGQLRNLVDLRWQSYAVALLSFSFTAEALAEGQARVWPAAVVIACLYCAQLLAPRNRGQGLERYARAFYSLLASLLLAVLLFHEVSGGALTMAWAAEALALLGAGFPLRDRVQRLSGLALFMACVLKLFLYDLRELETVNRILSFIVLGLILVGVSWMYTRFRDRIQRYL